MSEHGHPIPFDVAVEVTSLLVQWLEERDANVHNVTVLSLHGGPKATVMTTGASREIEGMLSEINARTAVENRWVAGGYLSREVVVHVTTTAGTQMTAEIWYMVNR